MKYDYYAIIEIIRAADFEAMEELAKCWDEFPCGKDDFIGRHWITNAIDCGSVEVVSWMLSHGASVPIEVDDGYTVLHSVIERSKDDKYRMMRILIDAGADVDEIGIHGFAPAHHAAVRNDVEALKILHESGADFKLRTTVDDYATPLEEARSMNQRDAAEAIDFLQALEEEQEAQQAVHGNTH
jgi:ankyrin repeat protein